MTSETRLPRRHPASFRDPAGFLYDRDGVLLRQVNAVYASDYDRLMGSGLYDDLTSAGLLVAHDEVDLDLAATDDAHRVLRPEHLPFVAYPYEWCPGQRRDAALLTLDVQRRALDHGLTLRDASAYNVQFRRGRPVFIDTLSFEEYREGEPWVAYRQFCQHFLAPLALEAHVDVRLGKLLATHIDGVPLDLAAELLPWTTKLRPGLLTHVHGQARASRSRPAEASEVRRGVRFSERAMRGLVEGLASTVNKLDWEPEATVWAGYYEEASHYSDDAMATKTATVARWLDDLSPGTVWDLGANTGRFSRLAAERGAFTVAWDVDHGAVQRAWRERDSVETTGDGDLLPLVLDLSAPSPAIGWANAERESLVGRGPADVAMALALVHHLAIGNNVPLERFAALLAELGRSVIVEWVPKSDPKVEVLLATREDVFDHYTGDDLVDALDRYFETADRVELPGGRELFLLHRSA